MALIFGCLVRVRASEVSPSEGWVLHFFRALLFLDWKVHM